MRPGDGDGSLLAPGIPINLDNCAREPIHIPGSIQPRGVLLAVRELTMTVTQVSGNLGELTGTDAGRAVGLTVLEVLGPVVAATIERATSVFGDLRQRNPHDVVIEIDGEAVRFDAILHRAPEGILLIELERANGPRPFSFPNTYLAVRGAVEDLNRAAALIELYEITARAVRELTGFTG
jgi:chemotaxis family two-component system sensor kinase Cph1